MATSESIQLLLDQVNYTSTTLANCQAIYNELVDNTANLLTVQNAAYAAYEAETDPVIKAELYIQYQTAVANYNAALHTETSYNTNILFVASSNYNVALSIYNSALSSQKSYEESIVANQLSISTPMIHVNSGLGSTKLSTTAVSVESYIASLLGTASVVKRGTLDTKANIINNSNQAIIPISSQIQLTQINLSSSLANYASELDTLLTLQSNGDTTSNDYIAAKTALITYQTQVETYNQFLNNEVNNITNYSTTNLLINESYGNTGSYVANVTIGD